ASAQPTRSRMSSTSRWVQMDREPSAVCAPAASRTVLGTPCRASSRAQAIPTGPAPTTSTGSCGTGASGTELPGAGAACGTELPGTVLSDTGAPGCPLPADRGGGASLGAGIAGLSAVLQRVPDLAVTLHGPDPRPLDALQFVPEPLHVERQAVFE